MAGFDVFGNIGHQLLTRLYMDFLRMESEFNFLTLLPRDTQTELWDSWYEGAGSDVLNYVKDNSRLFSHGTDMHYSTNNPKQELVQGIKQRLQPVLTQRWEISTKATPLPQQRWLQQLSYLHGLTVARLPQTVIITVSADDPHQQPGIRAYTLLHNNAHSNISSLLNEDSNLRPQRDTLTVVNGILGAYPSAYWQVTESQLPAMVAELASLRTDADYQRFMDHFGMRRTDPGFWAYSDKIMQLLRQQNPLEYGLLDYNRLENR